MITVIGRPDYKKQSRESDKKDKMSRGHPPFQHVSLKGIKHVFYNYPQNKKSA